MVLYLYLSSVVRLAYGCVNFEQSNVLPEYLEKKVECKSIVISIVRCTERDISEEKDIRVLLECAGGFCTLGKDVEQDLDPTLECVRSIWRIKLSMGSILNASDCPVFQASRDAIQDVST